MSELTDLTVAINRLADAIEKQNDSHRPESWGVWIKVNPDNFEIWLSDSTGRMMSFPNQQLAEAHAKSVVERQRNWLKEWKAVRVA